MFFLAMIPFLALAKMYENPAEDDADDDAEFAGSSPTKNTRELVDYISTYGKVFHQLLRHCFAQ